MRKPSLHQRIVSGVLCALMTLQSLPVMAALSSSSHHSSASYAGQPLPVDIRHGELVLPSEDLKVGIDKLPLALSRVYRSNLVQAQPGVFGWKWHSIVDMELKPGVGLLSLVDENGLLREYRPQQDGSFVSVKHDYEVIQKRSEGGYDRALKNGTTWHFDATYKLAKITDPNGRFLQIERKDQAAEKSIRITDRYGRFIALNLNMDGRVVRVMDNAGRMCLYGYDEGQNLVAFQSRAGGRIAYHYDQDHRLTELNPGGYRSFFVQYKGDKVAIQKTQLGKTATYKYQEKKGGALLVSVADGSDSTTTYEYRQDGTIIGTDPTGVKDTIRLNERELPVLAVGADGRRVEVEYDGHANAVAVNNNGSVTRFTYGTDLLTQIVSPSGTATSFVYDGQRNCTAIQTSRGAVTKLEWSKDGLLTAIEEPTGRSLQLSYDSYGQVRNMVAGDGQKTVCDFTLLGILRSVTLPTGVKINYQYDGAGQLAAVSNSEGQQAFLIRNEFGQVSQVVDPAGQTASFDYDPAGLLVAATDPIGAVTRFDHDKAGNMTALTDANGNVTQWIHDAAGRLQAEIDPLGAAKKVVYDQAGRPMEQLNARGQKSSLKYDSRSLLTSVLQEDGASTLSYDDQGRMTGMKNAQSEYAFSFTQDGLPEKVRDVKTGIVTEYQYDSAGRRVSMKAGSAIAATYQYDSQGQLSSIKSSLGDVRFEYDVFGRRSALIQANGIQTKYGYDNLNRVTEQITTSAVGNEIFSCRYQYDVLGNRLSMTEGGGKVTKYDYDKTSRLTRVAQGTNITEYAYDGVGNRINVTVNGKMESYATGKDNRLLKAGERVFEYDADGNMVTRTDTGGGAYSYRYDSENRLIEAVGPKGKVKYDYAPNGGRVARTEGDLAPVRFIYDQADTVAEVQDGKVLATYLHGPGIDQPLAMRRGGQKAAYHADGLGSITRLTDTEGNVVGIYEYDAFGQTLRVDSKVVNPFTYTGREWDNAAGAYFYRARFFSSDVGRFSSRDPLGLTQGANQYAYCANNPVKYTDPSGEFAFIGAGVGFLIGMGVDLTAQIVEDVIHGEPISIDPTKALDNGVKGAIVGFCPIAAPATLAAYEAAKNIGKQTLIEKKDFTKIDVGEVASNAGSGFVDGVVSIVAGKAIKAIGGLVAEKIGSTALSQVGNHVGSELPTNRLLGNSFYEALNAYGLKNWGANYTRVATQEILKGIIKKVSIDELKRDQDKDGVPDIFDNDDNNEGTPNWADPNWPGYDANGDGIPDNKPPEISYKDDSAAGRKATEDSAAAGRKAIEDSAAAGRKAIEDSAAAGRKAIFGK